MICILTYHAIGRAASPLFTPPETFERHIRAFLERGWHPVTIPEIVAARRAGRSLPEKSVAVTFDDAYASVYHQAWNFLKAQQVPATLFVITGFAGRDNRWPGQRAGVPGMPLMDWHMIAEMVSGGCAVGSHTHTHPPLTRIPPERAEQEWELSKQRLEEHTGGEITVAAAPYGAANRRVREQIRASFDGSVGTDLGLAPGVGSPYELPRIDSYYFKPDWIERAGRRRFHRYLAARNIARNTRRRFKKDWEGFG